MSFGETRIYGNIVTPAKLLETIGLTANRNSKYILPNSVAIHVGVVEYLGELYRVGGLCVILVNQGDLNKPDGEETPDNLPEKQNWPHNAERYWTFKNKNTQIIRMDAFVGTLFEVLIDPEVGGGPRSIRDMTGHNGNIIIRGGAHIDAAAAMTRVHRGGHLIE